MSHPRTKFLLMHYAILSSSYKDILSSQDISWTTDFMCSHQCTVSSINF
uniref:Uncharacterized protein n=1 Tax=Anguilla anguilla TaxID=7936 RepID=A0A0E9WWM9_ANGAN